MSTGCIDIYASRRCNYEYCRFWVRDGDSSVPDSTLVHSKKPDGCFYATEENPESLQDSILSDSFMFDENFVVISSTDSVEGISAEDLVEYDGRVWIVQGVQKYKIKKRSEFSSGGQYKYYIRMKC